MDKKVILKQVTDMEKVIETAYQEDRCLTSDEFVDAKFLIGCLKYLINHINEEKE